MVKLAWVEVNEEEVEWRTEGGTQFEEGRDDWDPLQVRKGREEEVNYVVRTLGTCELGAWEEATSKVGNHDEMDRSSEEEQ